MVLKEVLGGGYYQQTRSSIICYTLYVTEKKKKILIVLAIIAVAVFFRFYNLANVPPGLYPDEAMNGNDASLALDSGHYSVFYPNNNGREGLFINIQAVFIKLFGHHAWALRSVSAIFGVLTVWGLYLLSKELFDRNIAYLSSFLLAILFWHVNFSRIGFRAIMLPFILVFEFYFLWRAFKSGEFKNFIYTGIFAGLGVYTYISYRVSPLIVVLAFANYWLYIKKDFSDSKYDYAKSRLFKGFVVLVMSAVIVALPILYYFLTNSAQFLSRTGANLSVFSQEQPLKELAKSVIKTLGMFNFHGDYNWRHNISGSPELVWPIGALFMVGFIKEGIHWLKRKHGHFSTAHTLLFSWFFVMLLPGFLSTEAPHALRVIGVVPVVVIFAAKGLWWFYEKFQDWLTAYEPHKSHQHRAVLNLTLIIFIFALAVLEFGRYQDTWARNVSEDFNQNYVDIASYLNSLPQDVPKYVVVNTSGVLVKIPGDPENRSMPVPAQTVMFLTDTFTYQKQINKNLFYLTEDEFYHVKIDSRSIIIYLDNKND